MENWPEIPFPAWKDSCAALHLYAQMVGKYRLARTPWLNHSWHATLYPCSRGFTTGLVADAPGGVEIMFDLIDHQIVGTASNGRIERFALEPMSVAEFHQKLIALISALGGTPDFNGVPNEIPNPVPFAQDNSPRPYDRDAITRFFRASLSISQVMQQFRTGFLGKSSPVHLFWGSFDLAVTRFSGRAAPLHPGGIPALPDDVTREAYSHEVSSAGFWPGGGGVDFPAFYSYAYPTPEGFSGAKVEPADAYFDTTLGEFVLPYDAVRNSADPEAALMAFLETTYRAAADLGDWNGELECANGEALRVRPLKSHP